MLNVIYFLMLSHCSFSNRGVAWSYFLALPSEGGGGGRRGGTIIEGKDVQIRDERMKD